MKDNHNKKGEQINNSILISNSNPVYLLLENPAKSNNLGPILRCASAYAVHEVIFVGYEKCSVEGSHGASKHLNITAFPTFESAISYLRKECNVTCVIGIMGGGSGDAFFDENGVQLKKGEEGFLILDQSQKKSCLTTTKEISYPIHTRPFCRYDNEGGHSNGNFCFVVSKNRKGLPSSHVDICDFFVHVPYVAMPSYVEYVGSYQGENPSALDSLQLLPYRFIDVQSCLSIVLHHFTASQKYDERTFERYKFNVDEKNHRFLQQQQERKNKVKSERRRIEIWKADNAADEAFNGGLFDSIFNATDI